MRTKEHRPGLTQTPFTDEKFQYRLMEVTQLISFSKMAELTFGPNPDSKSDLFRMSQLPVSCMLRVLTDRVASVKESKATPKNQNPHVFLGYFMEEWKPWLGEQENTLETS